MNRMIDYIAFVAVAIAAAVASPAFADGMGWTPDFLLSMESIIE